MEKKNSIADIQKEEKTIALIREIKKELGEYRRQFEKDWKIYDDAYYGKQNDNTESAKTVKNHIFKIIESEIPVLTDTIPGTMLTAELERKQVSADILAKAIKHTHEEQDLVLLLATLMRSALTSAPGYLYVNYNPDSDSGDGKIEYRQLPWKNIYLDGNAQTIEKAEKAIIEIPMRRDSVARNWPNKYKEIMEIKSAKPVTSASDDNFETRDVSSKNAISGKPKENFAKDIVKYTETWLKSYELENIDPNETEEETQEENDQLRNSTAPDIEKWEDHEAHIIAHKELRNELLNYAGISPDLSFDEVKSQVEQLMAQNPGAEELQKGLLVMKIIDNHIEEHTELQKINPTNQKPKYEDGWRVIKSVENIVLYDGENPEGNGFIPLVVFYCYKDDTIYGFGEIKNILSAQKTLNDVDFRELAGLRTCSNPGWIADHEAFSDDQDASEMLTDEPGLVILKKRGTEVRRMEAGNVSPQLDIRRQRDQLSMESIAGQNEQTFNPAGPSANTSGVAIQKTQLQAVGRIRLKGRGIEYYSMKRLALIDASLIIKHWTQEKTLRLRSDDNQIEEVVYNPLDMEDLGYSVSPSPNSMAGVDKDSLMGFYLMLLNGKHIDFNSFLSSSPEFPGKHVLIKKITEANVEQNQIQQAKQQYEQLIQEQQATIQEMQNQNIKLKGSLGLGAGIHADLLSTEEKRIFDQQAKQAILKNILDQSEQAINGNMEPIMANQNNQG